MLKQKPSSTSVTAQIFTICHKEEKNRIIFYYIMYYVIIIIIFKYIFKYIISLIVFLQKIL